MFSVRVDDDLAGRFDTAAARSAGSRSALLRRLIGEAAAPASAKPLRRPGARNGARLMVRLGRSETTKVDAEARRVGMPRASWVAALVRRWAVGRPAFSRADELLLMGVRSELRRIGVNVNQIARALNTAVLEGRVLDAELTSIEDFRRELRGHVLALGEAFEGNLAYWSVDP